MHAFQHQGTEVACVLLVFSACEEAYMLSTCSPVLLHQHLQKWHCPFPFLLLLLMLACSTQTPGTLAMMDDYILKPIFATGPPGTTTVALNTALKAMWFKHSNSHPKVAQLTGIKALLWLSSPACQALLSTTQGQDDLCKFLQDLAQLLVFKQFAVIWSYAQVSSPTGDKLASVLTAMFPGLELHAADVAMLSDLLLSKPKGGLGPRLTNVQIEMREILSEPGKAHHLKEEMIRHLNDVVRSHNDGELGFTVTNLPEQQDQQQQGTPAVLKTSTAAAAATLAPHTPSPVPGLPSHRTPAPVEARKAAPAQARARTAVDDADQLIRQQQQSLADQLSQQSLGGGAKGRLDDDDDDLEVFCEDEEEGSQTKSGVGTKRARAEQAASEKSSSSSSSLVAHRLNFDNKHDQEQLQRKTPAAATSAERGTLEVELEAISTQMGEAMQSVQQRVRKLIKLAVAHEVHNMGWANDRCKKCNARVVPGRTFCLACQPSMSAVIQKYAPLYTQFVSASQSSSSK